MKKFLLGTVGLVALGVAAGPASAADLAARPIYTKAPPMIAAVYDWSGFYIGINGGWGSSHNCWDATTAAGALLGLKVAITPTAARSVVRSATAGRPASSCSVWKLRATGLTLSGTQHQPAGSAVGPSLQDGCVRPVHRPDRLCLEQRPALRQGRRRGDRPQLRHSSRRRRLASPARVTRPAGAARLVPASNIGFAPNWSLGVEYDHLFMRTQNVDLHQPGRRASFGFDNTRQDVDMVTVRMNYRWGGPVIAKY